MYTHSLHLRVLGEWSAHSPSQLRSTDTLTCLLGSTYEDVMKHMQEDETSRSLWRPHVGSTSFKFTISAFNNTIDKPRQRQIIESFGWMGYRGPVFLKNPDIAICVDEVWPDPNTTGVHDSDSKRRLGVWMGRKVRLQPFLVKVS